MVEKLPFLCDVVRYGERWEAESQNEGVDLPSWFLDESIDFVACLCTQTMVIVSRMVQQGDQR